MADEVNVGRLLVTIAADVSDLKKGRTEATKELSLLQQGVGAANRVLGAFGVALSAAALVQFAADVTRSAAAVGNLADQAGLSVQQFQGLSHALRDAQVPQEQLAQGMAVFARNMSDLQRGTGPFLDFLRQSAPHLIAQFQAAKSTSEAFGVLTDVVNRLGNQQDRLRLLNVAGADAFGRLANTMRQGRQAIEDTASSYQGLTEAETRAARDLQRRWDELWQRFMTGAQRAILHVSSGLRAVGSMTAQELETEIRSLEVMDREIVRLDDAQRQRLARLRLALEEVRLAADNIGAAPGPPPTQDRLQADAIRKLQRPDARWWVCVHGSGRPEDRR